MDEGALASRAGRPVLLNLNFILESLSLRFARSLAPKGKTLLFYRLVTVRHHDVI